MWVRPATVRTPRGLALGVKSPTGATASAYAPFQSPGQSLYRLIVPIGTQYTPVLDAGKFRVVHGPPGQRMPSPFGLPTDSKIGEAPKVFRFTVRGEP